MSPPIDPGRAEAPTTATVRRLEERAQRRCHSDVVALVDARLVAHRRRDRELDLDDAAVERPRRDEADVLEYGQHGPVLGEHLGDERLDPVSGGADGQLFQQAGSDPLALEVVCDSESGLGGVRVAQADVVAHGDDALAAFVPHHPDQGALFRPVRLDERAHEALAGKGEPVEAEEPATDGKIGEEVDERGDIVVRRGPQAERRAVTEDDVDSDVGMVHQFGHPGPRSPKRCAPASVRERSAARKTRSATGSVAAASSYTWGYIDGRMEPRAVAH